MWGGARECGWGTVGRAAHQEVFLSAFVLSSLGGIKRVAGIKRVLTTPFRKHVLQTYSVSSK